MKVNESLGGFLSKLSVLRNEEIKDNEGI